MSQNWYFVFSESSVFRNRYIKFYGTRDDCVRSQLFWGLDHFVIAILAEKDFVNNKSFAKYKELNIEKK